MKITPLKIPDLLLIEPHVSRDTRGFLFESFRLDLLEIATSYNINFVQDNHLKSLYGVFRGLHYQIPPYAQSKLVRVVQGEVLDIVVDLIKSSPTFGMYVAEVLSADNKKQMWIPEGFAHGFLTLSETSIFLYKTTNYYQPNFERSILWNDQALNIDWPKDIKIKISDKDLLEGKAFKDSETFP